MLPRRASVSPAACFATKIGEHSQSPQDESPRPTAEAGHSAMLSVLTVSGPIRLRRVPHDIADDVIRQRVSAREPPAERLDEALVAFAALGLRCGEGAVGQRRCAGQPEADEDGQGLARDGDMPLDAVQMPADAIEAAGACGFQPLGAVGREV